MNSEEIKKAFNICYSSSTQSCTGCPILKIEKQNKLGCKYNLFISAIGLITKQEKEIKNLKTQLEQPRKETVKEFAEKIKMAFYYEFDEIIPSIMSDKIDELLKEYEK